MEKTKLEKWSELLLDTGKRNNLINFKDRYSSIAEVLCPNPYEVFNKVLADSFFEPVNPISGEKTHPDEKLEDGLLRAWFCEKFSSRVKKATDVLLYTGEQKTINTVKNIVKKAKSAIEETGVNIAYMAFGFVHWWEKDGKEVYSAPLLLIPISFEGRGANKFPKIHLLESEITLNPSFAYKCEREFALTLPEYEGQSLEEYLYVVAQKVQSFGWGVSEECKIGTFSFLKINMYRDIEDNAERILSNENVKILLGEGARDYTLDKSGYEKLHCIVDADSSQEEAIRAVKSGKSIVLQGPPGTGKSQTITNIIAECLYSGKKVLFVSEKLAALNVVYEKLTKEGLNEFCLELHSHKANKKDFLSDLCAVLKSEKLALSDRVSKELNDLYCAEIELNEYKNSLHTPRENINKSVYKLISDYYGAGSEPDFNHEVEKVNEITEENLAEKLEILEEFKSYAESIAYDYRTYPWYGYTDTDNSYAKLNSVQALVLSLRKCFQGLKPLKQSCEDKFFVKPRSIKEINGVGKAFSLLGRSNLFTPKLVESTKNLHGVLGEMKNLALAIQDLEKFFNEIFNSEFYTREIDAKSLLNDLKEKYKTFTARLFLKGYKQIKKETSAFSKVQEKLSYKDLLCYFEKLELYKRLTVQYEQSEKLVDGCFGKDYKGVYSDWDAMIKEVDCFMAIGLNKEVLKPLYTLNEEVYNVFKTDFLAVGDAIGALFEVHDKDFNATDLLFDGEIFSFKEADFNEADEKLFGMESTLIYLSNWCYFMQLLIKAKKQNLVGFVNLYLDNGLEISSLSRVYNREVNRSYLEYFIKEDEVLSRFTRVSQDRTAKIFEEKDKTSLQINKAKIKAKLSATRPNLAYVAPGSDVSMILHEGAKKRMQKSVRRLLSEAGATIQLLKPCFLMSPLSVSTFLSSGGIEFDVVIFDEASQIFPQDAIGAIYRGKQLVVVGDSKQMPPSDFFMNTVTGAIEEDGAEEEISDYESILDVCLASFAQKSLRWHYRSKHESLIAFSNKHFYDGNLISFPATKKKTEGVGVDYYNVGGVYEQNLRINRKEAEAVADLVFKHFDTRPEKSLGVVAFNMAQQNYIEKVINDRRAKNPAYEKHFREDKKEYFFVKNLETVQGDERDVIIFSIAYGYNTTGKFIHNFGPLNHSGGERRLNVAVTRAKLNVKLVCSITDSDIDTERTSAEGARLLKEYIAFAKNGTLDRSKETSLSVADGFEQEVASFIREKGFKVELKLGESSAKIDIAVKSASGEDFVLAVECDGDSYKQYKTARDRDRLRKQVLVASGWKYYRVWSVDWFKNKGAEKDKLLKFLNTFVKFGDKTLENFVSNVRKEIKDFKIEKLKETAKDFTSSEIDEGVLPEGDAISGESEVCDIWAEPFLKEGEGVDFGFPVYEMADVDSLYAKNSVNFQLFVKEVLKKEAPLNEKWFLRRIVHLFGRSVVNSTVSDMYNEKMRGCAYNGIKREKGFLYLEGESSYSLRLPSHVCRRSIDYISLEELASGLLCIINHNVSIDKEGLFRTLAYRLGIMKMSVMAQVRMEQALLLIALNINIDGNIISKK